MKRLPPPTDAPELVIVLGLEATPGAYVNAASEGQQQRLLDWLRTSQYAAPLERLVPGWLGGGTGAAL